MDELKVGSFNVFNLVSEGIPYYQKEPYSNDEFENKTSWIASKLDDMKADIVGFQEVFHRSALETVLEKTNLFKGHPPIILSTNEDQNPAMTPAVGLATRLEVLDANSIDKFPEEAAINFPGDTHGADLQTLLASNLVSVPVSRFSRPVLKVNIRVNDNLQVTVFVVHLKSKRPVYLNGETANNPKDRSLGIARSLIRRASESLALRCLIIEELQKTKIPVVVIGDMNDDTLAVTTQMIAGEAPYYRWPFAKKKPYWDVLLYTAQQLQIRQSTRDTYFTHIFNGTYQALDHIMVSEEFFGGNPERVGEFEYARVINDHITDELITFERVSRTRSDHGIVLGKISLKN